MIPIGSYLFVTTLGGLLFWRAFWKLRLLYVLKRKGGRANGFVVDKTRTGISEPATVPVIRFYDEQGNKVEGIPENFIRVNARIMHRFGKQVPVYYEQNNPSVFVIDTGFEIRAAVFFLCTGSIMLIYAHYKALIVILSGS